MGRQWNQIIESLGPLTGGTMSINANLTDIEALLTTLQADVADGIPISSFIGVTDAPTLGADISGAFTYNFSGTDSAPPDAGVQLGYKSGGVYVLTSSTSPFPTTTIGTITNGTVTSVPTTSTSGGTGPTTFTSTTYGTIAVSNTNRKGLTIYNEGSGNLHVTLGTATTSTSSYTIRIIPTAYYEVPYNYTGLVGGIFATAGTARITEIT